MILESILSEEWENWGDSRWFKGDPQKPEFCIPLDGTVGADRSEKGFRWRDGGKA